jgi:hypothetical protein
MKTSDEYLTSSIVKPIDSYYFEDALALVYRIVTRGDPVVSVTEARLVNTLTSASLASRSRVISALGRYNQKCGVVENECV